MSSRMATGNHANDCLPANPCPDLNPTALVETDEVRVLRATKGWLYFSSQLRPAWWN